MSLLAGCRSISTPFVLLLALALGACSRGNSEPQFGTARARLHAQFVSRVDAISRAHKTGNALVHLQETTRALQLVNDASIRVLLPEIDYLVNAIARDGARPYLSLTIDVGYRLARLNHSRTQDKFSALARAVLAARDRTPVEAKSRRSALIRVRGFLRYRKYDENTAHAVSLLLASEFGRSQAKRGQTPHDIVRSVAMWWQCQPATARDSARTPAAKRNCQQFAELIANQLSQAGQGSIGSSMMSDLAGGMKVSTFACFEATDIGSQLVEEMEAFTACMESESSPPGQAFVDGASVASGWSGLAPELPGYRYVKSSESGHYGPNGNTGTQVNHYYENDSGGTGIVSHYTTKIDGQESSGTGIRTNDGNGTIHEEYQDANGDVTFSYTEYPDGSTENFTKHEDNSATAVKTNADGTSEITHTDKDGKVTTATVDANGKCEGKACTISTPAGEENLWGGCNTFGNPKDDNTNLVDPLGEEIYPNPETGGGGTLDPLLSCLTAAISGSGSECPPSVALCIEPPPEGSCGCGAGAGGGGPPASSIPSGSCNAVMCPEGGCNPQTGTCGGLGGGLASLCPPIGILQAAGTPASITLKPTSSFFPAPPR
jgi:hypothetical protein